MPRKEKKMRKIELTPYQKQQLEAQLKRSIKECNASIRRCNATGNKKSADYIREVKRKPLIYKLADVRRGYVFE